MARFLARRFVLALGILLTLSAFMYFMLDLAMDPLADLRTSTSPAKAQLIRDRINQLGLDLPWWERYWIWLRHFVTGDFGTAWTTQQSVNDMLPGAISTSVQLVLAATLIAIVLGVIVGLISALRQYTSFDYSITFVSFVLYALPVFWVAVLLKQFLAIGLNDYLNNPTISWPGMIMVSLLSGLFWAGAIGGDNRRKIINMGIASAVTFATLAYVFITDWLLNPHIGFVGITVIGLAWAIAVTVVFAGINNRRALYSALTTAMVGVLAYYAMQWLFYYVPASWGLLFGLLALAIGCGLGIGWLFGGPDRAVSMRGGALVAVVMAGLTFVDRVMQGWGLYFNSNVIKGRPIATIGSETPGLGGDFWITQLDQFTHLLLPTIALVLISFASYTRYQRGSMLEVLNQEYIRTARAKGLSERVVIVRHALRNALLPLASVVPVDIIALIGGAVITETIFGWNGMGKMFVTSLRGSEPDPVMAYVMITGALAMLANLAADFLYALLDPRIRVNA
ncbi:MAG: ABC transporter permease [Propionicimonas sp.]